MRDSVARHNYLQCMSCAGESKLSVVVDLDQSGSLKSGGNDAPVYYCGWWLVFDVEVSKASGK